MRTFEEIQADINLAIRDDDAEALLPYTAELDALATQQSEALACRSRGWVFYFRREYSLALIQFQRAVALYEILGERIDMAIVMGNMGILHEGTGNLTSAIEFYHRARALHEELGSHQSVAIVTGNLGVVYLNIGDFPTALSHFHRALAYHEARNNHKGVAIGTANIGNVYNSTCDYPAALDHYHRALALYEVLGDLSGVALVTANIGLVHMNTGDNPAALMHCNRALAINEDLGDRLGIANAMSNLGDVHGTAGNFQAALDHFNRALALFVEIEDRNGQAHVTGSLLETYVRMGSDADALTLLQSMDAMQIDEPITHISREQSRATLQERSGDLDNAAATLHHVLAEALELGLRSKAADIHKSLRDLALKQNNLAGYVEHNNEYTRITEEINGKETTTKLAMQAKQREIDAKDREHAQHMAVLHSTLPKHIADRVARGEQVNDHFDNASVLFIDVVGFTTHSSELDATVVVELLQNIFSSFDGICAKHDVTKIKTIGDSYMSVAFDVADAVGARPRLAREQTDIPNVMPSEVEAQQIANSEQRIANVALAMMASEFVWPHTGERVMFRIGIHCGPVVAGVLGTQRMQYDVWGDTVNVASRMESTSEPGKIHVSEALAKALNDHKNSPPSPLSHASLERGSYTVVLRGSVDVKGKGAMQTYWLEGA
ncbi:MAG: tetratricopeptide repeat protein [Ignavibacteria bacterium]|nr:tetratricopeptide repeat protein [Ignavibacteria bacterium]